MQLVDYMTQHSIDDAQMARRIGKCSEHAVKKWKYRERMPDAARIVRIEKITNGQVGLLDWTAPKAVRSKARAA